MKAAQNVAQASIATAVDVFAQTKTKTGLSFHEVEIATSHPNINFFSLVFNF